MSTSTPPRSVRSLADLGRLLNPTGNYRERRDAAYTARVVERGQDSPFIPCAACGLFVRYGVAVARTIGVGYVGYTHPLGECNPADVKAWRQKVEAMTESNIAADERKRMRAAS